MSSDSSSNGRNVLRIVLACIIIGICVVVFILVYGVMSTADRTQMNDGWTVRYNNRQYVSVDLYTFRFPHKIKKGDQIILENTIPLDIGSNKAMVFETSLSTVTVYVNRRVAYVYMNDQNRRVKTPGNGMNTVILPDNARGSECQVIINVAEDDAFRVLPIFYFVDAWNGSAAHINMYLGSCLVGFFESLLGVVVLCAAVVIFFAGSNPGKVFATGLMAFTMGIWSLYTGDVLELFSSDFTMNTQIGYLCLYFSMIPFSMLVMMVRRRSRAVWRNIIMTIGLLIPIAFFAVAAYLDVSGTAFVSQTYNAYLILSVVSEVLVMISTGDNLSQRSGATRILAAGIDVLFVGIIVDIVRYFLRDRIVVENRIMYRSIMPYISLAFIIMMLYYYLVGLNNVYMEQSENLLLEQLAYTDVLTGLANRAYYYETINEMQESGKDYTIISLDVNGLKHVNDTQGHAAGDRLIKDCAHILSEVFGEIGEVIRMGGDEFVIVINGERSGRLTRYINRMEKLEESVSQGRPYNIIISYGISSTGMRGYVTSEEVYKEADARMYDMKQQTKKAARR